MRLFGEGLDAGRRSAYRCRFGDDVVPATLHNSSTVTLLCITPNSVSVQLSADGTYSVPVEVAANAQDYTSSGVNFTFYAPPSVSALQPSSGIYYSGTSVVLQGYAA